jgi:cellobiose epimerase
VAASQSDGWFFNAWQLTGAAHFFKSSYRAWRFIQHHIIDTKGGEWIWSVKDNYGVMLAEDKVGIWKCPYHNSRVCLEIIKRIHSIS